jgi:hypothetical protein
LIFFQLPPTWETKCLCQSENDFQMECHASLVEMPW